MAVQNLTLVQGKTFVRLLRWESLPFVYKAISAITNAAPVSITTSAAHGLVDGWRVAVVSVNGMEEINASNTPPKDKDFHKATVINTTTVELNSVNSAAYGIYSSGGYLQFYTPVDMSGYIARMQIRTKAGGTLLASTALTDAPLNVITTTVDNAAKTIEVGMSAAATAAFTWTRGVYELEAVSPGGDVTTLLTGTITVSPEISTAAT